MEKSVNIMSIIVTKRSSPGVKITQAAKISWIDEKLKKEDSKSPGPKYEVSKHFVSTKSKK